MVEVRFPPPTRNITPQFEVLKVGRVIKRIFDPTRHNATATNFRYFGPLSRFDHHRGDKPELELDRGIIYAGFSLSCCLIEIFGDDGTIETEHWQIANITLTQSLKLLDLRGEAAWNVGSVTSMTNTGTRKLTQAWSRYFYENQQLYTEIDGLIFNNAHNGEDAIALYERAKMSIASAKIKVTNLNDPALKGSILEIANRLNLLVELN
jgi:hypothetical protein